MILKADAIWAGRGKTLRHGAVRVDRHTVSEIIDADRLAAPGEHVQDLGNTVILPGLVNAHTHLDLSHLKGKLIKGSPFPQWLKRVARARALSFFEGRHIRSGVAEVVAGGAVAVGDVSVSGKSAFVLHESGLAGSIVYCEVIGINPAKAGQAADHMRRKIELLQQQGAVRLGISPHAPYSVSPELFEQCLRLCISHKLPMAIHVAETESEVEMLTEGTGELRELLETYDLLPPDWRPPGKRPVKFLHDLGILDAKPLLIHCNHIDDSEASLIAKAGCTVCYCPRSNAFFRRTAGSLDKLLGAGVKVAIGTDSLASNDSLSMLAEMKFLKSNCPDLDWETIFEMATINGARALGIPYGGLLGEGLAADITAVEAAGSGDPVQGIFARGAAVRLTMADGRTLHAGAPRRKPIAV